MPSPRNICRPRPAPLTFALVPFLVLPSCRSQPAPAGGTHETLATYSYRKLSADLPDSVRVQAAAAAAQAALLDSGYSIKESAVTDDSARIEALPPDAGMLEKVVVTVAAAGASTRIGIVVEPWGNQARSRAILDRILSRLGR